MGFWDLEDEKVIQQRLGGRGRPQRRSFGIARYAGPTNKPRLLIPANSGASIGQRVRYKLVEGGVAFRIAEEGEYAVFAPSAGTASMCALLPDALAQFTGKRARDIITQPYHGGWFVPFDQFEKKGG
jgi:hypothetical protein